MNPRLIPGLCAMVAGLALCAIGLWILLRPMEYQAAVKIEITSDEIRLPPGHPRYDPYWLQADYKIILNENVLSNVVEALNLETEWGKRYAGGRRLSVDEAVDMLRQRMEIKIIPKTRIVEVQMTDEDSNKAVQMATEIGEAHNRYVVAQREKERINAIKILEESYAKEESKILLMQSNLDIMRRQLPIIDTDPNDAGPSPTINSEQLQHLKEIDLVEEAEYLQLKNEFAELQSIQATNPAALHEILPAISRDEKLTGLLGELGNNVRKLAAETNEVGAASSDNAATQALITHLNQQIDARVNGIMSTLKTRVDYSKTALDILNKRLKEFETEGQPNGQPPYWEAKRNLDSKKNTLELLKAKIEFDKSDAFLKSEFSPSIYPAFPVSISSINNPNRKFGTVLLICGLAISAFGFYSLRQAGISPPLPTAR